MSLRTVSRGDGRRRRVLNDETLAESGSASVDDRRRDKVCSTIHYSPGALTENQRKIVDVIPHRLSVISLAYLLGASLAGGIVFLATWPQYPLPLRSTEIVLPGTLFSVYSALLWTAGSLLALANYSLRRHRLVDYRARYRVWIWTAICCGLAAVSASTHLTDDVRRIGLHLTGSTVFDAQSSAWPWLVSLPMAAIFIWLLRELVECRASLAAYVLAIACWTTGLVFEAGWIRMGDDSQFKLISAGTLLGGQLTFALSLILHRRYLAGEVARDVEEKEPRSAENKPKETTVAGKHSVRARMQAQLDSDAAAAPPTGTAKVTEPVSKGQRNRYPHIAEGTLPKPASDKSVDVQPSPNSQTGESPQTEGTANRRRMTKAERKALRKRQQQDRTQRDEDRRWIG